MTVATVVCVGLSGCMTLDHSQFDLSRVEGLREAPGRSWDPDLPSRNTQVLPHAVTNKGIQIERSLGVR